MLFQWRNNNYKNVKMLWLMPANLLQRHGSICHQLAPDNAPDVRRAIGDRRDFGAQSSPSRQCACSSTSAAGSLLPFRRAGAERAGCPVWDTFPLASGSARASRLQCPGLSSGAGRWPGKPSVCGGRWRQKRLTDREEMGPHS